MNFRRNSERMGGSFPIWKISLQIWCWCNRNFRHEFLKKKNAIYLPEKGAGGSKVVRSFSKKIIHLVNTGLPYLSTKLSKARTPARKSSLKTRPAKGGQVQRPHDFSRIQQGWGLSDQKKDTHPPHLLIQGKYKYWAVSAAVDPVLTLYHDCVWMGWPPWTQC